MTSMIMITTTTVAMITTMIMTWIKMITCTRKKPAAAGACQHHVGAEEVQRPVQGVSRKKAAVVRAAVARAGLFEN